MSKDDIISELCDIVSMEFGIIDGIIELSDGTTLGEVTDINSTKPEWRVQDVV